MLTASSGRAIRSTFKICVTDNPMHSQMIYGVKKYQGARNRRLKIKKGKNRTELLTPLNKAISAFLCSYHCFYLNLLPILDFIKKIFVIRDNKLWVLQVHQGCQNQINFITSFPKGLLQIKHNTKITLNTRQ
jgi:hypothetical protein